MGSATAKHIDSMNVSFTDPPKEFLVSGSSDHGHSWRQVFGTDLNTSNELKIPVHGEYTHLKITFLQPQSNNDVFGVLVTDFVLLLYNILTEPTMEFVLLVLVSVLVLL